MRFAYADPPYLGCAARLYDDPTFDAISAHKGMIDQMCADYPDGWAMSLSSPSLQAILPMCPPDVRVAAWVKPFAVFKPNVNPAYAWEPVIWRGGRTKRGRKVDTVRDWHSECITMRRGVPGAKPPGFVAWIVGLLGADVRQGDTITDLFHGSGAMLGVWRPHTSFSEQVAAMLRPDAPQGEDTRTDGGTDG